MWYCRFMGLILCLAVVFSACSKSDPGGQEEEEQVEEQIPEGYVPVRNRADLEGIKADLAGKYILMEDIDLKYEEWVPLGLSEKLPFTGHFNGNGHIIRGLKVTDVICGGLFGYTDDALIYNVSLKDCDIQGKGEAGEQVYAGSLVGVCGGQCMITRCSSTGSVKGAAGVVVTGGLVGQSEGIITRSWSSCSVEGHGTVLNEVGGLTGGNYWGIVGCFATGKVSVTGNSENNRVGGLAGFAVIVVGSYATGKVAVDGKSEKSLAGGLVGFLQSSIGSCYTTGDVVCSGKCGNLIGEGGSMKLSYSTGAVPGRLRGDGKEVEDTCFQGEAGYYYPTILNISKTRSKTILVLEDGSLTADMVTWIMKDLWKLDGGATLNLEYSGVRD